VKLPDEILNRKEVVTRENIVKVRDAHIGYKWRPLGVALNIPEGVIDNVEYENRGYGLDEMVYKMLTNWTQSDGSDATVGRLAKALGEVELVEVAIKMTQ